MRNHLPANIRIRRRYKPRPEPRGKLRQRPQSVQEVRRLSSVLKLSKQFSGYGCRIRTRKIRIKKFIKSIL